MELSGCGRTAHVKNQATRQALNTLNIVDEVVECQKPRG
jgi:hypothetical protein